MKLRTKTFAVDCWKLCSKIPKTREYNNLVFQLLKSSSSVAANWRASQRPKSDADFVNKLKIVEEEADETGFWLEMLLEILNDHQAEVSKLLKECNELTAITVASIKTTKKRLNSNS